MRLIAREVPWRRWAAVALLTAMAAACGSAAPPPLVDPLTVVTTLNPAQVPAASGATSTAAPPTTVADDPFTGNAARYRVEVVERFTHDTTAFTQGLVTTEDGFFESTGLRGESTLREVSRTGEVLRLVHLAPDYFAEGLERHDGRLVQLTWQAEVAFVYDAATFEQIDQYSYEGEGWGLCSDGTRFVMSNGTDELSFRDLETFDEIGSVRATVNGAPQTELNELECIDGRVYANVWTTDAIVRIDPRSGAVDQVIDASGLLTDAEAASANVLNGIARADDDSFYLTGKRWPWLFRVRFVPA